ncbi:hypothetical protein [Microbacterium sp. BLY]|uniref:hypothetical protein n=1 Tax=Microbacterium sp. BLY TaxID=2823280 RepID=UPI001B319A08|nr:hypothetical protein [Microbacterium sp. BLY]MBP3978492.1 hypothetical protein [Microbacterium sp. BLY]
MYATVLLARQATQQLILVIEGADDDFVLKQHLNEQDVLTIPSNGGKGGALQAAKLASEQSLRGVRFLVDADYDRYLPSRPEYPDNVTSSHGHDTFADMLFAGANLLERVIESHSRSGRRNGATFDTADVRAQAVALAAAIAPLRLANELHSYGLNLRGFPFGKIASLPADEEALAKIAIDRSGTPLSPSTLVAAMSEAGSRLGEERTLVVGDHDLFGALSRVLREHGISAGADAMAASFLAGLLCAHLGSTDWYRELNDWGAANSRVTFACPCAA